MGCWLCTSSVLMCAIDVGVGGTLRLHPWLLVGFGPHPMDHDGRGVSDISGCQVCCYRHRGELGFLLCGDPVVFLPRGGVDEGGHFLASCRHLCLVLFLHPVSRARDARSVGRRGLVEAQWQESSQCGDREQRLRKCLGESLVSCGLVGLSGQPLQRLREWYVFFFFQFFVTPLAPVVQWLA